MTLKNTLIAIVMGVASLQFLSACAVPSVPQDRYYRVDITNPAAGSVLLPGVVETDRFSAVGLAAGRAIVYTTDEDALVLQEYNYDFWHEPPSIMLRDALIGFMRSANVATSIVTPEMRAEPDYLMSGRIQRLEVRRGSAPNMMTVELELAISDARNGAVLMVRSYRTDVPATDASVEAAVVAANQAVNDIYGRFLSDLKGS